jgi:hypothetical protein
VGAVLLGVAVVLLPDQVLLGSLAGHLRFAQSLLHITLGFININLKVKKFNIFIDQRFLGNIFPYY